MKITKIQTTPRIFNQTRLQQNQVHFASKSPYDTVSFGMTGEPTFSITTLGNYEGKGYEHFRNFEVKGHAKAGDLAVDETLKTGSWIEAGTINTQAVDIGDYAHVTGKVTAERLETGTFFEAGELDARTVRIGQSAKITGKAKAGVLSTGNYLQAGELDVLFAEIKKHAQITGKAKAGALWIDGDLNIGNTDIKSIHSCGDIRFQDITRLDKLTIAKNLTNPTKNVSRTLLFDSAHIAPEKIKIVLGVFLGDLQELVIHTVDKSILNKLEFFHENLGAKDRIGERLLPEAIAKLVKFI